MPFQKQLERHFLSFDIRHLWYKGTYYPTTLSQVNGEEYTLIGWYDGGLRAAGGKIRVLIAVRKN